MKTILEALLSMSLMFILCLIGGVMESDLSLMKTILWIAGLFVLLLAAVAGLGAVIGGKEEKSYGGK